MKLLMLRLLAAPPPKLDQMDPTLETVSFVIPVLIAVFTIPVIWRFAKNIRNAKVVKEDGVYKDEDGEATEESMKAYSTKWSFVVIFLGTGLGVLASLALAVIATIDSMGIEYRTIIWTLFWTWVFTVLQVLDVFRETRIVTRWARGVRSSISFFLIVVIAGIVISSQTLDFPQNVAFYVTLGVQIGSALTVGLTFILIKRRPDVFANGKVVERQLSSSIWTRYTYNWSSDILDLAATKLIEPEDLPSMDAHVRANDVKKYFRSIILKPTTSLWLQIFWAYRGPLIFQWFMVMFSSIIDIAPQVAMLQLLRYLEVREGYGFIDPRAWLCVGSLLIATALETLVDYRITWLMWSELGVPIRSTLNTLIFEKMMKLKDCKEPPSAEKDEKEDKDKKANGANGAAPHGHGHGKPEPAKKDADKKKKGNSSQQDIINMFAVDTNQVGVFGAINQFYIMFFSKFVVSVAFLWVLVGWESLLAGMFVIVIFFPVNKYLAGRYGKVQKELMKARDKKTKVISEALQGIRQIKFSANEAEWTDKINEVREDELILLWQTKLNNLNMLLGSDIAPIFLTVLALATYSYIHGDLMPSVAFTALGVFMQLEGILGMVPFLMMMGINAKVSCDRIDKFLQSKEKPENTYPGDSISFDKVSVSFPSMSDDKEEEVDPEEDEEARQARENKFILRDLTLQFPNNALSVILGPTGAGKSLLLAAILGEVDVLSGSITVPRAPPVNERFNDKATAANWIIPSAIAFVAQTPWIENASIKDNILFGLPHDEVRYEKVLKACALTQDLELFDDGDLTEVGAQGISLSGGQKWRLTLARALYSRSGILILDDVFSALDAHVGKYIYDNALMGELAEGRTRVLVTHHASLCLPRAKYAVCLSARGVLEHAGLVKDLRESSVFQDIVQAEDKEAEPKKPEDDAEEANADGETNGKADKKDRKPPKKLVEDEGRETGSVKRSVYMTYLKATGGYPFWVFVLIFYIIAQGLNLSRSYWIKIWTSSYEHKEEVLGGVYSYALQTQVGNINTSSTFTGPSQYIESGSGFSELFSTPLVPKLFSMFQASDASIGYPATPSTSSFSASGHAQETSKVSITSFPINVEHRNLGFYLLGYIIISLVSTVIDIGRFYVVYRGSLRASRKVFRDMTYRVLRTPLRWLDTVPTGRILNRFTADFTAMDSNLSSNFAQVAAQMLSIVGIMVSALLVSPYIILFALLLLIFCGRIALRYLGGARSIKRLESIQKSPMISHFTASLQGLSTIRAFGSSEIFETRMHKLIDSFTTATWHSWLFNNWVGFRMSMVGSLFSTLVAAFVVSTKGIDASLGGFALAFALSYRRTVNMTLRLLAATELDMNAAERIFEYSGLAIEPEDGMEVRASWPEKGELEIKDLEVGYAEDLPAILKGLNVHVEMNQRVGIVGRTGAGKSTLSLALFRFLEARRGSITIDGVDISKINLHSLRTRLAIIPQDPVLFSGTIRSNLDPFNQFSDFQVREALQRVHLIPSTDSTPVPEQDLLTAESSTTAAGSSATSVTATEPANKENTNIFLSLSSPISSSGANLSQGQKQLLCLARAILSRPKLLLLDEATSAVDKKTDTLIQRSIREEFANTTLLVIAHRLSTVMDFDKILVMKDGVAAEYGTPGELLEHEDGVFKGMVAQSGEKDELEGMVGSS